MASDIRFRIAPAIPGRASGHAPEWGEGVGPKASGGAVCACEGAVTKPLRREPCGTAVLPFNSQPPHITTDHVVGRQSVDLFARERWHGQD